MPKVLGFQRENINNNNNNSLDIALPTYYFAKYYV